MKKIFLTIIIIINLIGLNFVLAQTNTPKPNFKFDQRRQEIREKIQERRQAVKSKLEKRKIEIITVFWKNMLRKLEAAIRRLEKLAEKIDSRINKFEIKAKEQGKEKDLSFAKGKLAQAREEIKLSKSSLEEAKMKFQALLNSDDPKSLLKEVKNLVSNVITRIRKSHRLLVEAITLIKGSSGLEPTPIQLSPSPTKNQLSPSPTN